MSYISGSGQGLAYLLHTQYRGMTTMGHDVRPLDEEATGILSASIKSALYSDHTSSKTSAKTLSGFGLSPLLGAPLVKFAVPNIFANRAKKFADALGSLVLSP